MCFNTLLINCYYSFGEIKYIANRRLAAVILLVSILFYTGCKTSTNVASIKGPKYIKTELYFGLSKPDGTYVSQSQWQKFVDEYITPSFSKGLTIVDANGRWMDTKGKVIKEKTKIVILLYRYDEGISAAIESIRDKYKALFQQQAVLRINTIITEPF